MLATPIKTHKIQPGEKIFTILDNYLPKLKENQIIAITSKVISACENRLVSSCKNKEALIKREAEICFPAPTKIPNFCLTLKNHRLIPNAGIDESNCKNTYILLPKNPRLSAKKIWQHLRQRHRIKNLGIIITDSNITPLRNGVTGITIGWCGFKPLYNYIDKKDLYGRTMQTTKINLLDNLATVATLIMGEGKEKTPIAIIDNIPKISFQNRAPTPKEERATYIDTESDLFSTIMSYD
jgi:dihydrofolate synthase / folylpolyglutamate synthase